MQAAVRKPVWTTSSFLLYAGGLTVLGAVVGALAYLASQYGSGAYVAWALLPLFVLYAVAFVFRSRGEWIAAGVFAFVGLLMWINFLGALESWWGWLGKSQSSAFGGWHWGALLVAALAFAAAIVDLLLFRFPLLVLVAALAAWYFVTDVLSGGGSWTAVVTLFIGLVYLLVGVSLDRGRRRPYGFWLHLLAGLLIGGALLYWWHSGDTDYALLSAAAVVYVGIGVSTGRSSWAVLGVGAILVAFGHFSNEWASTSFSSVFTGNRDWVPPLVFGIVGFFIVLLGLLAGRRAAPSAPALPPE